MILEKIKIQNYRLLKDFEIDLQNDLSLILGKNNCGKTSLLTILEKMLDFESKHFSWNDFSLEVQEHIYNEQIGGNLAITEKEAIKMTLFIKYNDTDSYANLHHFMMDLDTNNNLVVIEFSYMSTDVKINSLRKDLLEQGIKESNDFLNFSKFMQRNSKEYFELRKYSRGYDISTNELTDEISSDLTSSEIKKLISFRSIKANREASNKYNNHSLSNLSAKYYKLTKENNAKELDALQRIIKETDDKLNIAYNGESEGSGIFQEIIKSVEQFGGHPNETKISIQSAIEDKDLLKDNTILYYEHNGRYLPESYNGLGYLNLIGMIFEIETILTEFKQTETGPSDINLLFLEEPEAHTHPQLQYIFINNIKQLVKERVGNLGLQTIITTHSPHITADCDFEDIKYLTRSGDTVVSKNFISLYDDYKNQSAAFKFVKQYLTLHRAELFFADKAIFVEGDTERILLPAMMKKIDDEHKKEKPADMDLPMLSQNISVIEVGAHAYTFKPLIDFLGIKALIITDIDGVKNNEKINKNGRIQLIKEKCPSVSANYTSNSTLKNLFNLESIDEDQFNKLVKMGVEEKVINNIRVAYQTSENHYHARSFEDAFISLNFDYIKNNIGNFNQGIKNPTKFIGDDYYNIAENCIDKKTAFATEILYFGEEVEKWSVPEYIREGLLWLRD